MTLDRDATPEEIQQRAAAMGLPLTDEEAVALARGVARNRQMAARNRLLLEPTTEPATTFAVAPETSPHA